jgi:hypothetical protein
MTTTTHFIAHNPASIWQVPDAFRSIYSHVAEVGRPGRMLFISGQFGVAPDGKLAKDFPEQCEQAMDNVEALLAAAALDDRPGARRHGDCRRGAGAGRLPDRDRSDRRRPGGDGP